MSLSLPVTYYAYSGLVNCLCSFLLGAFILLRNPAAKANRLFAIFCLLVAEWAGGYFLWQTAPTPELADFYVRTLMLGAIFVPPTFVDFVFTFIHRPLIPWFRIGNYAVALLLSLTIYSPAFAGPGGPYLGFPYWPTAGPLFTIQVAHLLLNVLYSHLAMYHTLRRSTGLLRSQMRLLLIGTSIGYVAAASNYFLWYRIPTPPVLTPLVTVYTACCAYAIIKHRMFDIGVLIKKTVVFAGLSLIVLSTVGVVSFWLPGQLFHLFGVQVAQPWRDALSAMLVVLYFERVKRALVDVTDRYLFQKRYDERALLTMFTNEVMGLVDRRQLAQMTVTTLTEMLKVQSCSVLLLNREAGVFEFVAFRGLSSEAIAFDAQDPFMAYFRERREPLGSEGRFGEVQVPMAIAQQLQALEARLCLPIVIHDELEGLVLLGPKKSDRSFTEEDVETLVSLTKTLAVAVANARLFTELAKTQAEVAEQESLAITDSLTGLFVRRHFVERSMVELARCKRYNHSCALLMVDLDHYKDINDRHGHLVGDVVLQEVAQLLRRHLRDTDVLGRFGGDELLILLVETNTEQAVRLAQRLRRLVEEHPIGVANDLAVAATVSIGLATFPDDADSVELLMARADEALYFAKRAGRNGVMHIHAKAGLPEETPPNRGAAG